VYASLLFVLFFLTKRALIKTETVRIEVHEHILLPPLLILPLLQSLYEAVNQKSHLCVLFSQKVNFFETKLFFILPFLSFSKKDSFLYTYTHIAFTYTYYPLPVSIFGKACVVVNRAQLIKLKLLPDHSRLSFYIYVYICNQKGMFINCTTTFQTQ